jgi:hypothetical protein
MKKIIAIINYTLCFFINSVNAQKYTSKQFGLQLTITNMVYGLATNYLGETDTLKLDIYKPSKNSDKQRPILLLNHGGAWVGGDKSEINIINIAKEFTQRGYVVASVNYRLGTHKANWASNPFQKEVNAGFHAVYIADSAEIYRAWYRAIQDLKGAIRFMKARHALDSTCPEAVFIGGESAGGFNALGVAFLDLNSEKPASCNALADVPTPQSNLLDNYPGAKVTATQLKRPDLGDIEGSLNLNGYNAKVKGVLNLFGGFLSEGISNHWLSGNDSMLVYMTHQSCDGIVPCNAVVCLSPLSVNCNLGYTPFHTKWPISYGSCALKTNFTAGSKIKKLKTEIFNCDPIVFPLTDCLRFANNGSYHYLINTSARCDSMAKFIGPTALKITQNCQLSTLNKQPKSSIEIYPNPNNGHFIINGIGNLKASDLILRNQLGQEISFIVTNNQQIQISDAYKGLLMIYVLRKEGNLVKKILVLN